MQTKKISSLIIGIAMLASIVGGAETVSAQANGPVLDTATQGRLLNLTANIYNRDNAAITRMQNIIDRMYSRAKKFEYNGVNMDSVWADIATAEKPMADALDKTGRINADMLAIIQSPTPKQDWLKYKGNFATIQKDLEDTRANLEVALGKMRAAASANPAATSNPPASAQ